MPPLRNCVAAALLTIDDPVTEPCELVADPNFREPCLSTFVVREARVIDGP